MEQKIQRSLVLETPPAAPGDIHRFYMLKLAMETDASDVNNDRQHGTDNFVLVDVRSAKAYEECHITGAINLPANQIDALVTASWPKDKMIVAYCWGPACNGATKASAKLSALGFQVKEMLGGIEYWRREGYDVEGAKVNEAPLVG
ncbi:rhodanese-related sulfurtransferase [Paenibacillus phyllosphaerae]|uniref:Rhodanese-related sulfurtransferase n=1 Tax=Paenibacillus phyllosphaerae TaxID=274593 RepID=A0A7W5AX32_9BACL|nr:rhodanese-like domain-containing protein [Paenibacillus phyllosphaerae]MBB3110064.1 rhodanese-related sulfurtransferase [Paenibacillus phyllosphaerae]